MKQTARMISGEKSILPIDKNIQRVELQISKSCGSAQEESDYCKYNNDPKMWSKAILGNIALEELFEEANKAARRNAELYTNNEEAQTKYIAVHGNCVAVSGQAGMGKTTLTKQLIEKVLQGTHFEVDFPFYVSLRNVNFDEKVNVLQFLLTNPHSGWEHDALLDKAILKELVESDKVMIIIDGLDEAAISLEDSCPSASITDITTPEVILKNLLNGHILPKAKKLITSRPRQLLELHENYRPHFIVDVLGLNSDAQKQICLDICGSDCDHVYLYLNEHAELSAQCFVPIICIFTLYSLHQQRLNPDNSFTFATVTNIILYVLENFARLRVLRSETLELEKLSKLAWEGLRQKKYEFSEDDLHRLNLKRESLDTVLTTGTNSSTKLRIMHCEKITYFSHLILQEFFSATYLILLAPLRELKEALFVDSDQTNLEVVKKFLFGLCNPETYKRLLALKKSSDTSRTTSDLENRNRSLQEYFSEVVQGPFLKRILSKLHLSSVYSIDFSRYLVVCLWIYESQQQELTKKLAMVTSKHLSISGNIFPHEVSALCYVLRARVQPMILEFKQPKFVGDSCERLFKEISVMQKNITVSIDVTYSEYFSFAKPSTLLNVNVITWGS